MITRKECLYFLEEKQYAAMVEKFIQFLKIIFKPELCQLIKLEYHKYWQCIVYPMTKLHNIILLKLAMAQIREKLAKKDIFYTRSKKCLKKSYSMLWHAMDKILLVILIKNK